MLVKPTLFLTRLSQLGIDELQSLGVRGVLLDVDNTILTRDTHEVPADIAVWLERIQASGLKLYLVSNNWHASVYDLSARLGVPIIAKAIKPLPFALLMAKHRLHLKRSELIMVGDQLVTDVFGAKLAGIKSVLLRPLVAQDLKHTLALRHLERVLLCGQNPRPIESNKIQEDLKD